MTDGLVEGVTALHADDLAYSTITGYEAAKELIKQQAMLAQDIAKGRDSTNATRLVLQATSMIPSRGTDVRKLEGSEGEGGIEINIYGDVARKLLRMLDDRAGGEVIEGEWVDEGEEEDE
jgi:hypothetical protein